jgi:metal-responsive CopG/Arc/MetJ family transcriptional regulator
LRIIVEIEDRQIEALDEIARSQGRLRAALIRDAVTEYLVRHAPQRMGSAFGLWGNRKIDGLDFQAQMRSDW